MSSYSPYKIVEINHLPIAPIEVKSQKSKSVLPVALLVAPPVARILDFVQNMVALPLPSAAHVSRYK